MTINVTEIKRGTLMCQVRVRVAGGAQMESVMTLDSADAMGLKLGDKVIWTALKGPANRVPTLPHFSMRRPLQK